MIEVRESIQSLANELTTERNALLENIVNLDRRVASMGRMIRATDESVRDRLTVGYLEREAAEHRRDCQLLADAFDSLQLEGMDGTTLMYESVRLLSQIDETLVDLTKAIHHTQERVFN